MARRRKIKKHTASKIIIAVVVILLIVAIALGRVKHRYAGTEYLVEELGVLPAWQGRGVGSALLAGMRRVLKTKGVGTVVLFTDRTLPAYKFYIGKGFSEQKEQAFPVKEL